MSALPDDVLKDPVCGMSVSAQSKYRHQADGREYSFCSARCRDRFIENPEAFLTPAKPQNTVSSASDKNVYTCPMHPDIRQSSPGSCPKCGMALEPVTPPAQRGTEWTCPMHPQIVRNAPGNCPIWRHGPRAAIPRREEEESGELRDMTRRFWFATALTVPLVGNTVCQDPA